MAISLATRSETPLPAGQAALPSPAAALAEQPLVPATARRIDAQRAAIRRVLHGEDDRLLVIAGPCSLHDANAAHEYAVRLQALAERVSDDLSVVMRAYIEKPRSTIGWKGLLHDPYLSGAPALADSLRHTRDLLRGLADQGVALATELLSPMAVGYITDLLSWGPLGPAPPNPRRIVKWCRGWICRLASRTGPTARSARPVMRWSPRARRRLVLAAMPTVHRRRWRRPATPIRI